MKTFYLLTRNNEAVHKNSQVLIYTEKEEAEKVAKEHDLKIQPVLLAFQDE